MSSRSATKIITRFAPSPTGFLHVGGARSALFNYLFARQNGGQIILRIEDTDLERNKEEYVTSIVDAFKWLGLDFDKTHRQSENFPIHRKYLEKLIVDGKAYVSKEEVKEEGQRSEVIRFKNPDKDVIVDDMIKGAIKFNTTELGDFVIAKSLDEPIFHLSNVVDDIVSGITHVIRGEEHLSNTPRQILIWEAVGERPLPKYAHIPLILSEQREKISKRKHGEIVSVEYYKARGYLPEALINFLAFLGWNPGDDRELFTLDELVAVFDVEKIQKAGAVFNPEKLKWYNKQYLQKMSDEKFMTAAKPFLPEWLNNREKSDSNQDDTLTKLLPLVREKAHTFDEMAELFGKDGELAFIEKLSDYKADTLLWKKNPDREAAIRHLLKTVELFETIDDSQFTTDTIKQTIWPYAEENGKGDVLWPLRMALTGQEKSPDPFTCAFILGKGESLSRINRAIESLKNR